MKDLRSCEHTLSSCEKSLKKIKPERNLISHVILTTTIVRENKPEKQVAQLANLYAKRSHMYLTRDTTPPPHIFIYINLEPITLT